MSQEPSADFQEPFEPERMSRGEYIGEVFNGVGVALGLALLWLMEIVRDAFFALLDRLNVKPRRRRNVSAFPPSRASKRPPEAAPGAG
ncbi:MAG TPA: hypothetical protein VFB33_09975 [Candidatus Binataceae bacterium]|nr:hypothetical protein [Candidatus Binataceae bacterium]